MNKVAIVIPARNEEKYIGKCLDSILNQSYPVDLIEIIVIDGMSTDKTASIVLDYAKKYKNIKLLYNERRITPISLNLGIKNSTSDIVIILGAHSYIDRDFVKNNVRNLTEKDVDCSGGVIDFINEGFMDKCIAIATSSPFGVGNALYRYSKEEQFVDTVPFGAYKRKTLDKIGYFDEELVRNQDDELNYRLIKNGGKILLSPDIISHYFSRSSLKKLWTQYKQYGFWKVRVIQKHRKPASIRHLIPVMFVLGLLGGVVISIFSLIIRYLFSIVICIYLLLAGIFAYRGIRKYKGELCYLPIVMLTFFILHLSYGLGFLEGIVTFYITKNPDRVVKNTKISR